VPGWLIAPACPAKVVSATAEAVSSIGGSSWVKVNQTDFVRV
jgi:hypothetical protein